MAVTPHTKARFLTLTLFIFGIVGWLLTVHDWLTSLPLAIFYVTLVSNTYFSVCLFAAIIPKDHRINNEVDALLVFSFFLMAFNMHRPLYFLFFDLLLFILATIKYTLQMGVISHPRLLKKKVLIDLTGCLMCLFTLGGALLGYVTLASWAITIVFLIANFFLLFHRPMYRIID
jgi:hypothetical protein